MTTDISSHPTLPPNVQMLQMINALWIDSCLYIAATYSLADIIAEERVSVANIAAKSGLHPDWAYRILRALAFVGIFHEVNGEFENTPMSHCLREDHPQSLKAMARTTLSPRSMVQWANFEKIVQTTGVTVPEQIWGKSFYELLDHEGTTTLPVPSVGLEPRHLFDDMLGAISAMTDVPIAQAYAFAGTVCDLGGSKGTLLAAITKQHPEVKGILFDRPAVIELVKTLNHSFDLVAGDFFVEVPTADTYILKEVFHNWSDEEAASIMKNCRRANPNATVLVAEQLIENPRGFAPLLDILMGVEQRGRERTREEYARIGDLAGYTLSEVYPTKSPHAILEFKA